MVFLGDIGAPLNAAQEAAFQAYYKDGGGFFAVGSAIESEPDWAYLTELLGTRADGAAVQATNATIKVADRVHLASRSLPEYWTRSDRFYNFKANVRGVAHVLATVDETTYDGGTMTELADHPVAWCKDYEGGRAFYTNVGASGDLERRGGAQAPGGRDRVDRRRGRPGLQRLRRDRARELPADQDLGQPEPQRADRHRGRCPTAASCRRRAAASCACTTPRTAARK